MRQVARPGNRPGAWFDIRAAPGTEPMDGLLHRILTAKRAETLRRKSETPEAELTRRIADLDRPRNFFQAVTRESDKPLHLIAEIARASPSAGVNREDFDPVAVARAYDAGGASALSVVTDGPFFRGSLDDLRRVRAAVALPVLRKDFILEAWQVYESRAAGADGILLVAEALPTNELIDLQILATELHMTCLIEVHGMDALIRVRDAVIGFPHRSYSLLVISNRDPDTFHPDLKTTLRLAELVEDKRVLVSEGGISTRDDVAKLADAGVRAMIVGETLLREPDVTQATRLLLA